MTLIKALGLAAVAVVAAMAFIGTSSAFAEDEVVLCVKLIEKEGLCPNGLLWPNGTKLLALAKKPRFVSAALEVSCEDATLEAHTVANIAPALPIDVTAMAFGALPIPALGNNCKGCTEVHVPVSPELPFPGEIKVEPKDDFLWKSTFEVRFLHCTTFNIACSYGSEYQYLIEHKGIHPLHEGEDLPVILIRQLLARRAGSSPICPEFIEWVADYVFYLAHWEKSSGLFWPALDDLA